MMTSILNTLGCSISPSDDPHYACYLLQADVLYVVEPCYSDSWVYTLDTIWSSMYLGASKSSFYASTKILSSIV
jgi:hypothetical protein